MDGKIEKTGELVNEKSILKKPFIGVEKIVLQADEVFTINAFGQSIPLPILKMTLSISLIIFLVFGAYHIGHHDTLEQIKFMSYISTHGICDQNGICQKCIPIQIENKIDWSCYYTNSSLDLNVTNSKITLPMTY